MEYCCNELQQMSLTVSAPTLDIRPLYSALPIEMQNEAFAPAKPGSRLVVVATNIAETSITIKEVTYVIDLGYVKQTSYNHQTRMTELQESRISKAAADQRKGRAGRTGPGKCFRLYSQLTYE